MNVETDLAVLPATPQPATDVAATAAVVRAATPWVTQAWRRMLREPSLMFTAAYVLVSFLGLWANYWFYRGFDLPILEYMQASDYLVAGLRDPVYALLLVFSVLLALLVSWPETFRRDHPERVVELRRRWWGRLVFMDMRGFYWKGVGLAPETGIVLAVFWGVVMASAAYVTAKAGYIRDGSGNRVVVTLAGDSQPQPHGARLLGTSGAFVFLWWPDTRRAEAVPVESIARLQTWIAPAAVPARPAAKPAPRAAARPASQATGR